MKLIFLFITILFFYNSGFAANQTEECLNGIKNLGPNWRYSSVFVPLKWDAPSETIEVNYYYKDQSLVGNKTPIVFLNGGPTLSAALGAGMFDKIPALKDQNIIIMDQRGTGCSTKFPLYTSKTDPQTLQSYSTDSIVKDAEEIRRKMFGTKKWKIWGQSFGGVISFRYLEYFPESIHSAHIHGFGFPDDQETFLYKRELSVQRSAAKFLAYKKDNSSNPTAQALLDKILNPKSKDMKNYFDNICIPTPGALKHRFCGNDLFSGFFLTLGFRNAWSLAYDTLQQLADAMEKKDRTKLTEVYKKFANQRILRFNDRNQAAALHVITYNELIPGYTFYDGCNGYPENKLFSECYFERNFLIRLYNRPTFYPNIINLTVVKDNIHRHKVPIYYYGGVYDSFAPVDLIRKTAELLEIQKSLHIFPNSGHEGYYAEELVLKNLTQ